MSLLFGFFSMHRRPTYLSILRWNNYYNPRPDLPASELRNPAEKILGFSRLEVANR